MTTEPRITLSPNAVLRAAAWPVETVDAFAAPGLAAAAADLLDRERRILERRDAVVGRIHAAVPTFADRSVRAHLLAVKRRIHGGSDALPQADPAVQAAIDDDATLAELLTEEREARGGLAGARSSFEERYEAELARQSRALRSATSDPRFGQALLLANPLVASRWERAVDPQHTSAMPPKRVRDLEGTVFNYLMRAAGRPSPSGAWSGVSPIRPVEGSSGLRTTSAPAVYAAAVNLMPFLRMLQALASAPRYRRRAAAADDVGPSLPPLAGTVWEALEIAAARLLPEDRARWTDGAQRIRTTCLDLGRALGAIDRAAVRACLAEIHREMQALAAWAGSRPIPDEPLVYIDMRLPFAVTWSEQLIQDIERAVAEVFAFHAADGRAESARRHRVAELTGRTIDPPVEIPFLTLVVRGRTHAPDGGTPSVVPEPRGGDEASSFRVADENLDRTRAPGPWGTVLVRLAGDSGPWIGAALPQPAMFVARHGEVLRDGPKDPAVFAELEGLPDRVGAPAVEVAGVDATSPNAALRPRLTPRALVAEGDLRTVSVLVDADWRPWLRPGPGEPPHLPVYNSAAIVGRLDPCSAVLFGLAGGQGWDLAASRLPSSHRHWSSIPRTSLSGGAVLAPRRWLIDARTAGSAGDLSGASRYLAWMREVAGRGLPMVAYVRTDPDDPEILMPMDSPLAVETLFEDRRDASSGIIVTELPGAPDTWPVVDANGQHYAAEIAVTWYAEGWGKRASGAVDAATTRRAETWTAVHLTYGDPDSRLRFLTEHVEGLVHRADPVAVWFFVDVDAGGANGAPGLIELAVCGMEPDSGASLAGEAEGFDGIRVAIPIGQPTTLDPRLFPSGQMPSEYGRGLVDGTARALRILKGVRAAGRDTTPLDAVQDEIATMYGSFFSSAGERSEAMLEHLRWLERVLRRFGASAHAAAAAPHADERFVVASRLAHAQFVRLRGPAGAGGLRAEVRILRSLMNAEAAG